MFTNYYSPTPESIGKYPLRELFYNACKAGYTVDNCMVYFSDTQSSLTTAIATRRDDVVEHLRQSDMFSEFFRGRFTTQYMQMLLHRDMTPSHWANMIIEYSTRERVIALFESKDSLVDVLKSSYHPIVSRLADRFDIKVERTKDAKEITPETIILRYKLGMTLEIDVSVQRILCCYDTETFPSYDIFENICSGNYNEVAHKINTVKAHHCEPSIPPVFMTKFKYVDYLGVVNSDLPPVTDQYFAERLATIGHCRQHLSPADAEKYLSVRKLH